LKIFLRNGKTWKGKIKQLVEDRLDDSFEFNKLIQQAIDEKYFPIRTAYFWIIEIPKPFSNVRVESCHIDCYTN
jgi:hypothetical protein